MNYIGPSFVYTGRHATRKLGTSIPCQVNLLASRGVESNFKVERPLAHGPGAGECYALIISS